MNWLRREGVAVKWNRSAWEHRSLSEAEGMKYNFGLGKSERIFSLRLGKSETGGGGRARAAV